LLSRIWTGWRKSLVIVMPDTVIRWHHKGFKLGSAANNCRGAKMRRSHAL
jgi:hypothetical protein